MRAIRSHNGCAFQEAVCGLCDWRAWLLRSRQGPSRCVRSKARRSGRPNPQDEMVRTLIGRLDLDKYKATVKGLTQFGDRRQGTERNRKAVDWIEAQLKSYGCPTERSKYQNDNRRASRRRARRRRRGRRGQAPPNPVIASGGSAQAGQGGSRPARLSTAPHRRQQRGGRAARRQAARAQSRARDRRSARAGLLHEGRHHAAGRDVHHRRAHGRTRLGRSGQRQRLGHGAGDGARAHLQHAGRRRPSARFASRCGTTKKPGSMARARTSSSAPRCRAKKIRRDRSAIPSRSGWQ